MKTSFQLEIPRRGHVCAKGGENLTAGMDYYSALVDDAEQGLSRKDYCLHCWESTKVEALATARSHWKSKVLTKKEEAPIHLNRDERILYLLKESLALDDPESIAETYVLALYCARRRLLYLRQEMKQEDGQIIQLYEVAATEEMLPVKKVQLSSLQIDKIQIDVAKKLKN